MVLRAGVVRRRLHNSFEQLRDFMCDVWATVAACRRLRAGVGLNVSGREGPQVVPQTLGKASIES